MFNKLKTQIQDKFKLLSTQGKLFYVEIDRDKIWELYLDGFTDPAEKQGHNCNCCKSFLRQYAGIVSIVDNKVQSLWDLEDVDDLLAPSVKKIRDYIHSLPVTNVFMNKFDKLGTEKSSDTTRNVVWQHFYLVLPKELVNKSSESIESIQGGLRDNKNVLKRSLDELTEDSVDTILDLIAQNSLYRGKEFEGILLEFQKAKREYKTIPAQLKDNYCWVKSTTISQALSRIRNTSIGTLLIDLSENVELDIAVTKFEKVVAPTNYKRPSALVTPKMVEDAKSKLQELGLLASMERRFATAEDLDIKNILFVDKSSSLTDVFEEMKQDLEINPKTFSKVEEISIKDFIDNVLPKSKAIYALLENVHLNNMNTLLTASDKEAPLLFKWKNPFSWSYTGGITDSIKERVKEAGGKVDGELRVSLSWYNFDDLDLHVIEPNNHRIYYGDKKSILTTGELDVDMNAGGGHTRNAVENIVWTNKAKMLEGNYQVKVNNYNLREMIDAGFVVQIECNGEVFEYEYKTSPRSGSTENVIDFHYSKEKGITIQGSSKAKIVTKEKWGLKTNRFHKVKNVMLSPNHWNEQTGNKHFMFILEHCSTDEPTRPFFNEFLNSELDVHRKFFEVLGSKLKLNPPSSTLSGVGFSETQRNHLIVQVDGSFKRTLKINF